MAMSGNALKTDLKSSILGQLQTLFPMPSGLQAGEQTRYNEFQDKLAEAIGYGDAPITVTHITSNAVVSTSDTGTVTSGAGSGGSVIATGIGTVS